MAENPTNTKPTLKPKTRPCPHCRDQGKEYLSSCQFNLDTHIREAHTEEKPYPCSQCQRSFTRAWLRNRHAREVHGVQHPESRAGKAKARKTAHGAKMAEQRALRELRPAPAVSGALRELRPAPAVSGASASASRVEPLKSPDLADLLARADNTDLDALLAASSGSSASLSVPTGSGEAFASSAIDPNLSDSVYPSSWSANATIGGPPFRCEVHGVAFATMGEWMLHGHEEHDVLWSVSCPCEYCQTVIRSPDMSA